jgi:hypothetical protein
MPGTRPAQTWCHVQYHRPAREGEPGLGPKAATVLDSGRGQLVGRWQEAEMIRSYGPA